MSETTRYYISEDDVVRLMEDHKKALAEIERLRAALRDVIADYEAYEFLTDGHGGYSKPTHNPEILRRARAALEGKD